MRIGRVFRYHCKACDHTFERYMNVEKLSDLVACENCETETNSIQTNNKRARNNMIIGAKVTDAEYNPGLGQVVKSNYHKKEIMKAKDIHEVGNDYISGEKQQKEFEKKKQEEKDNRWKKASYELGISDE